MFNRAISDLGSQIRDLPPSEQDHARIVELQFRNLTSYLERFRDGLELFALLRTNRNTIKSSWVLIPCREAAMVLWHYARALDAIKFNLARTSTLRTIISIRAVQQAIKDFSVCFPDVSGMRHSVGHTSELFNSPEELKRNSLKDAVSKYGMKVPKGTIYLDNLINDTFTTASPDGAFVKLEMNVASLEKLSSITTQAFSAISARKAA
jgi:hypothetical protein